MSHIIHTRQMEFLSNLIKKFRINRKKSIAVGLLVALVLSFTVAVFLNLPEKVEAAWWDDTFGYRHRVSFTHNASITNPRAVTFTLDTAELITAGLMQSDCDDTRFTTINGEPLSYDLTGTCNNASTTYEVIFPSIVNGSNVFYVYYGNPSATNAEIDSTDYTALTPSGGDPSLTNPTSSGNQEKSTGPIAYWRFDEGYGTTVQDASSNNSDGTIDGAAWQTEDMCVSGKCLYFDGTNDKVTVGNTVSGVQSVSFWVRPNAFTSTTPLVDLNGTAKITTNSSGVISASGFTSPTIYVNGQPGTTLTANKWQYVSVTTGTGISASAIKIGTDNTNFLRGFADEVKLYNYALTSGQVKSHYIARGTAAETSVSFGASPNSFLHDGLVGYWKMDESATNSCTGGSNDSCDSSGNNNDAAWSDNASAAGGKYGNAISLDGTNDRVVLTSTNAIPSGGSLYNTNWTKRVPITVTNDSASTLTDYQVRFTVAYTGGMQSDFDDLRFTTTSETLLDHWVESKTDNDSAIVWVEVDSIPASSSTTIYMYYGNESAESTSNINSVFLVADDFEGSSLDAEWTEVTVSPGVTGTFSNGRWTKSCTNLCDWWQSLGLRAGAHVAFPLEGGSDMTWEAITELYSSTTTISNRHYGIMLYQSSDDGWMWGRYGESNNYKMEKTGSNNLCSVSQSAMPRFLKIRKTTANGVASNNNFTFWLSTDGSSWTQCGTYTATDVMGRVGLFVKTWSNITVDATFSFFAVKKYATSEPSVSFGTQENITSPSITISAWVNGSTLDGTTRTIIARNNSDSYSWMIGNSGTNPGKITFTADGAENTGISTTTLATNAWHHVALASDGTKTRLYINGSLDLETPNSGMLSSQGDISIGADPDGTNAWHGKIDEIRIYNRALSAQEVSALYNWSPGPLAYWKLDEKSGTTAYDTSGNNYTGTFTGAPAWTGGKYGSGLTFTASDAVTATISDPGNSNTISLWVYPTGSASSKTLVTSGKLATDSSSRPTYGTCTGTALSLNTWTHISAVSDGASICRIYQNGVLTHSNTTGVSFGTSVNIAAESFTGSIDDVKIYNYARTTKQVVEDMNAGHPAVGSPVGSAIGHWKFDEGVDNTCVGGTNDVCNSGSGGSALDGAQSGMAVPATSTSGWTNSGRFNKALSFDGSNDYVLLGTDLWSNAQLSSGSMSVWYKPSSVDSTVRRPWSIEDITTIQINASNQFQGFVYDGDTVTLTDTTTVPQAGTWYQLTLTWDGTTIKFYTNGQLKDSNNQGSPAYDSFSRAIHIGASRTPDSYALGQIDDVKIYNFALTADEVRLDYNRGSAIVLGTEDTGQNLSGGAGNPPIAEWKFNEKTGQTVYDTSSGGRTGTLGANSSIGTDDPAWRSGEECKSGSCLTFGGDDFVVFANNALGSMSGSFTLSAWVKTTSVSTGTILSEYHQGTCGDGLWSVNSSGFVTFHDGNASSNNGDIAVNDGRWHHVVYVYNGSTGRIYTDTVANTSTTGTTWRNTCGSTPVRIGSHIGGTGAFFNGTIDDVKVYNYARTFAQIAWDYNRGAPVAWWKFDECQGNTAYDSSPNPSTNSGYNGNNGTITPGDSSGDNDTAGSCNSGTNTEMWNDGTTGKRNASIGLDGTNDYVSVADTNAFTFTDANFSVSAWVKFNSLPSAANEGVFVGKTDYAGNQREWKLFYDSNTGGNCPNNQFAFAASSSLTVGNFTFACTSTPAVTGQWYHVVGTATGGVGRVYINGYLAATNNSFVSSTTNGSANVLVGAVSNSGSIIQTVNGQIDDVRIYNYALSPTQVKEIMNNGSIYYGPSEGTP